MAKVQDLFNQPEEHTLGEQLALLADISQCFASSLNIEETLKNAIEQFVHYMDAEAASIFLLQDDHKVLVCHECVGPVDICGLRLQANQGIVGKAVMSKTCRMVRDVTEDEDFSKTVDMGTGFQTRSILCAPLLVRGECIGALELINKRGGDGLFDEEDRHIVMALASASALAIHNARMATEVAEQERIRRELDLARELQLDLLPDEEGTLLPIQGKNVPALEVSGDFYDFFKRPDGRIYFNLADVSGKGMNSALLMAKVSSLLHHLAKTVDEPGKLLTLVNEEVCETVSHGMFVTIVTGFIDSDKNQITLANAGHQPPLYHHPDGQFQEIPALAPPLGIMPGTEFPESVIKLDGGCLYLFTDGVTEASDERGNKLNVSGLIELIRNSATIEPGKRLEELVATVRNLEHSQHDDITMMMIECEPV